MSTCILPFFVATSHGRFLQSVPIIYTGLHKDPKTDSTGFDTFQKEHLRPLRRAASQSWEIPNKGQQQFGVGNEWERCGEKFQFFYKQIVWLDLLKFLHGWPRSFVMYVFLMKDCFRHHLEEGLRSCFSSSNLLFGTLYISIG